MRNLTWGDSVRISMAATPESRRGEVGEIVGIRDVQAEAQARQFDAPIGTRLYLIEFGDGDSIELAEMWVDAVSE